MDPQEKERIAQEKYGKSYDQLSTNEQKAVGGEFRKEQMGGTEGYSEMGKKGGQTQHEKAEKAHGQE